MTRSLPRRVSDVRAAKDKTSQKSSKNTPKNDVKSDDSDADDDNKERQTRRKVVEADDFKIVFISSDSSKESDQVNSSLEACPEPEKVIKKEKEEMDWAAKHRTHGSEFAATSR